MPSPANPIPSTDLIAEMKAGFTEVNAKSTRYVFYSGRCSRCSPAPF